MKIMIKAADLLNKVLLKKNLNTLLKKPVEALVNKKNTKVQTLPFCYEVDYFGKGEGFLCIGETKEVTKAFQKERVKGNGGKCEKGKKIVIDKKKVAHGLLTINKDGQFEFQVHGGAMKKMDAKNIIKGIPLLKKNIGENFIIVKGTTPKVEPENEPDENNKSDKNTENAVSDKTEKAPSSNSDAKAVVKEINAAIVALAKEMKGNVITKVIKRIKAKKVRQEDSDNTDKLLQQLNDLKELYKNAEARVQKHLEERYNKVIPFGAHLDKVKNAIEKALNKDLDGDGVIGDGNKEQEKLLEEAKKYFKNFKKEMKGLQKDISKATDEIIVGGQELLNSLF